MKIPLLWGCLAAVFCGMMANLIRGRPTMMSTSSGGRLSASFVLPMALEERLPLASKTTPTVADAFVLPKTLGERSPKPATTKKVTTKREFYDDGADQRHAGREAMRGASTQTSSDQQEDLGMDCARPRPVILHNNVPPGKPWIHLGLPKSGTTTLEHFWKCGGLEVGHSVCKVTEKKIRNQVFGGKGAGPKNGGICPSNRIKGPGSCRICASCMEAAEKFDLPPLASCGNYSAYAQLDGILNTCYWPQLQGLQRIHEEAPHATFVYMYRNVDKWVASFQSFRNGQMKAAFKYCRDKMPYNHNDYPRVNGKPLDNGQIMYQFHCQALLHARRFVAEHPSHTLYEFDLDSPETPHLISQLFGIDQTCWGVRNVNAKLGTNRTFTTA